MPVRLEQQWLLIDARSILEVLGEEQCLAVPQASAFLPAVAAWRGRALAVLDLSRMLGIPRPHAELLSGSPSPRTLILETIAGRLAVPVSEAKAVFLLEDERLLPVQATSLPHMSAEVDDGSALVPVLDLAGLVSALTTEQDRGPPTHA